jgi:Zn finger protein HypA/HybF involved in hydrogenase expression
MTDNVIPMRSRPHIKCPHCEYPMSQQKDRNFQCVVPNCGRGYLRAEKGVNVRIEGKTVIYEAPSDDDDNP